MKSSLRLVLPALLATLLPLPLMAQSPVFDSFSYQGRVTDAAGALVGLNSPVSRKITIKIYDASALGTLLFAEEQNAIILNGEFSIVVGGGTLLAPGKRLSEAVTGTVPSNGYWLGVTVDDGTAAADPEITPRQKILAAPFAVRAATADNLSAVSQDMRLNNKTFFLSTGTDSNAALRMATAANQFGSTLTSGPILYGNSGGVLGTKNTNGEKAALEWGDGSVLIRNNLGVNASGPPDTLKLKAISGHNNLIFGVGASDQFLFSVSSAGNADVGGTLNVRGSSTFNGSSTFTGAITMNNDLTMGTGKLINGNVNGNAATATSATSANKLLANSSSFLVNNGLYFRGSNDLGHGIKMDTGSGVDGPSLFGNAGGSLGYVVLGDVKPMLNWTNTGATVKGNLDANSIRVGADKADRESNAGFIKYAGYSDGLDIVGAGTTGTTRKIAMWAEGGTTFKGPIILDGATKAPTFWFGSNVDTYSNTGNNSDNSGNATDVVLNAQGGRLVADRFSAISDARLKKITGASNGANDLAMLTKLQITDYVMKDDLSQKPRQNKKVIAQQVAEVFPQAVSTQEGAVPDLLTAVTAREGLVTLKKELPVAVKKGDMLKVYAKNPKGGETSSRVTKVAGVTKEGFQLEDKLEGRVFLYGHQVNDLRSVDYEAIAMLNVSATQEIKKELDAEVTKRDAEIKALRAENVTLRAALEKSQASFETRLAALEKAQPESSAATAVKTVSTVTRKPAVSAAR